MKTFLKIFKKQSAVVVGFVGILFLVWCIATSSRGVFLTREFFDPIRNTSSRDEVVIVGIDDASLTALGAWPFDRSVFAKLTKQLTDADVRAIVFDVLFLEPRSGDEEFKQTLSNSTVPIILAAKYDDTTYHQSFLVNNDRPLVVSALANVAPDADGKVRNFPLAHKEGDRCIYGLSQTSFSIYTHDTATACSFRYSMFRYPARITTYSLVDIISGKVPQEKLQGKVIFVGSVSLDLLDHFVGMSGDKIPGVYVHASMFTSLLNEVHDIDLNQTQIFFALFSVLVVVAFLLYKIKSLIGQLGGIVMVVISTVIASVGLFSFGYEAPLPWMLFMIVVTSGYITMYRFIKERKTSEHIKRLFSKYVHKDVLHELLQNPESLNLEGEKREMTILFSDLRGFTTFSETLEPEELTSLLNGYFSAMTPCILKEKGTIDKFIGDAIMAFWNAPLYVADHETHAVRSALLMLSALDEFNKKHGCMLAIGVGINRGNVVVGNVGSDERVNYTVLGDAVNLASRVEGLTKKYGVLCLVTEEVSARVLADDIIFRKLDIITVKGKSEPTTLFEAYFFSEEKKRIFRAYEQAFKLFQEKSFDEAGRIFKNLADEGDEPSKIMLERSVIVKNDPTWTGVWHFDEK